MKEIRHHPRIITRTPVTVTNGENQHCNAQLCNLSPGGIMIDGDEHFKQLVCADPSRDPMSQPVEVGIACLLPGEATQLNAQVRLIYIRRLSQFEYNLGFRFIDLNAAQALQLERYVNNRLHDAAGAASPHSPSHGR